LIKLADYSPAVLRFIKTNDLAAIYVFAVAGYRPVKIGHTINLRHRHGLTQEGSPEPITIEHLMWTPSVAVAALIAEDVRHRLGVNAGRAGWWNVEPAVAIDVVRRAAARFPSRNIFEHEAFLAKAASAGFAVPVVRFA
jgi:hypothetical protein